MAYLTQAAQANGDSKQAKEVAAEWFKTHKANLKAMVEGAKLPGGLVGALVGRMVTSDPRADIDAAVHVAHAFTVHAEEAESDYFIAADDLARDEDTGADTIQETELTSGLFCGYVVVDLPALIDNLGGDRRLAGGAAQSGLSGGRDLAGRRSWARPHPTARRRPRCSRQVTASRGRWPRRSATRSRPTPRRRSRR